jgi:putative membrane protein
MAFGFVIERFGLFLHLVTHIVSPQDGDLLQRGVSYWVGIAFIGLGALASVSGIIQYRKVLRTLKPIEIPTGYAVNLGVLVNLAVAVLGGALTIYLFHERNL